MELVKQFNSELSSLYESKPPISKAKMTSITRTAIKAIKLYKHVVQSVEKFIQKCKPEYKVPGLYVIDSIVRQSRHQFGTEKDVFAPRFARNLQQTFIHLFNCPPEDKSKVIRVLNLWQKNTVFESEVIQPLFDLADPNHPVHKEQVSSAPSNGITPVKPVPAASTKSAPAKKEGGTAGWINQLHTESNTPSVQSNQVKPNVQGQLVDVNILHQLQQLQSLLLDQQSEKNMAQNNKDVDQVKFDKKLLDFDYGEEEDEDGTPAHHHHHHQQQQQQQVVAGLDSIGSILSNPEVLRQLQTLQQTLSNPQQNRQQQLDMEEKLRKMQEMRQQEEEFDKHLAQTIPNLPFADECELKPGGELSGFPGMDLSQPPPGYLPQQKLLVPAGMMLKPPPSPLEDGEHTGSDADDRIGRSGEDGVGPSVVVLDSDSPSDSPATNRRRRRRSRSRSHRRSRSDSRTRSRSKRKRSSSFDEKDWDKVKQREAEKEKERERKRKGLPPLKRSHLAVCSTTLWIGHLSKLVQQEELSDTFGEFGDIVSIDLIPPRGCAFICMNRRQDAYRALQDLKHHKLQGKAITLAWAPGKGMKGKEYKDYWEVEQGVSYIPWSKLTQDIDLDLLEDGGMIDEESFPEWLKERQQKNKDDDQLRSQSSSQAEDDEASKGTELDIPVPAPTLPGYIPLPEGPQPTDIKVSQPPPAIPPIMPPLSMMPPFGLPNVPRLLGPMGMAMGPGLMPNVPLGVPPPGMQGLMGNPLMHQQMIGRMPQPVGSPFNHPPGVGILGGHPQLSQIPLPSSQDKGKSGLAPLGVPPPTDASGLPQFTDPIMQIPFTLPPQLQMPGMGLLPRPPMAEKQPQESRDDKKESSSPARNEALMAVRSHFGHPPPQFSPMSLMKIPPPTTIPSLNKADNSTISEDKDEREQKDKDYRDIAKDYKDRDKERERDRDYRNKRDRDYRGDRDYRDRFDKDYRERDKDYRDKDRERKDRGERSRDDKSDLDFRDKEGKNDEKDRKEDSSKDDKTYRDRNERDKGRNRDRERDRDRDRGRDRMNKWGDRDRERGRDRDRDDKRGRDRERDGSKEMKGNADRDKGATSLQDRLRSMAHDQDRSSEFSRGPMEPDNFQGSGGPKFGSRNDGFNQDGFPLDMHGHHRSNRREGFEICPRDMFDHRGPPPDGFDPRGPPPEGFGPRGGPHMDNFGPRGPPPDGFGPRGPPPDGFGPRGPPPDGFDPRGPPPDGFDPRGPPPDGFDPRGPPPDGFDPRGPPPGGFGPPDGFDPRGLPPDFDGQGPRPESFNMRGPPPDGFNRGLLPDKFGPGIIQSDSFPIRGPHGDEFGPHGHSSFEGFNGPHGPSGEFQPRIRIEFFPRGRGRGGLQDSFRGRGTRGGVMFSPRVGGPRGPRPGGWMEAQGPSPPNPVFGFPPRGFAPSDTVPERFGPPIFEENGRGRGGPNTRGRGRGFQGRSEERRREEEEAGAPSPKRMSRWSNPSPPPAVTQLDSEEFHTTSNKTASEDMQLEDISEPTPSISQPDTHDIITHCPANNVEETNINDENMKSPLELNTDLQPTEVVETSIQLSTTNAPDTLSPSDFDIDNLSMHIASNNSEELSSTLLPQDSELISVDKFTANQLSSSDLNENDQNLPPNDSQTAEGLPFSELEFSDNMSFIDSIETSPHLERQPSLNDSIKIGQSDLEQDLIFDEPRNSVYLTSQENLPTIENEPEQNFLSADLEPKSPTPMFNVKDQNVQPFPFESNQNVHGECESPVLNPQEHNISISQEKPSPIINPEEHNIFLGQEKQLSRENEFTENSLPVGDNRLSLVCDPDIETPNVQLQAKETNEVMFEPQVNEMPMPSESSAMSEDTVELNNNPSDLQ